MKNSLPLSSLMIFHFIAYHILYIHSSTNGPLGGFYLFTIVNNNSVINIDVQIYVLISVFICFEYIPRSGIAGSYGNFIFIFLESGHTVFCGGCTILHCPPHPPPAMHKGSYFSMSSQIPVISWFVLVFHYSYPNGCEMAFHCGFDFVSLMMSDVENCFMSLFSGSFKHTHTHTHIYSLFWRRKWQPTPVFLPGESQGWGSLVGCHLWGHTELDTTEAT